MRSVFRGRTPAKFRTLCSSVLTRKPAKIFEGTLIHSLSLNQLEIIPRGRIGIDEQGEILFVAKSLQEKDESVKQYGYSPSVAITDLGDKFMIPGFIDTHTHAPQYVFTGTGTGLPLLQWLEKYTFPYESKFSDPAFAEEVYSSAVSKHLSNGSTTTVYFGTIHTDATLQLARIAERHNQRAYIGKVNMDRNSPDHYRETTEESIAQTEKFVEEIIKRPSFKKGLVVPVITPRFVPTCTPQLLRFLGDIAWKYHLPIQSHISENKDEIEWVKELHPDLKGYADVYDHFNLLNDSTIMAHACHLTPEETQLFSNKKVGVSHCPLSNISLNSGFMPLREMLESGVKVGLGTDVSGGYSPSMLNAMRMAIATSAVHTQQTQAKPLSHIEAFYLATLGGSELLGEGSKLGNFKPGNNFDALVVDPHVKGSPFDVFSHDTVEGIFEKFIYLGDDRNITDVYVQGEKAQTR